MYFSLCQEGGDLPETLLGDFHTPDVFQLLSDVFLRNPLRKFCVTD